MSCNSCSKNNKRIINQTTNDQTTNDQATNVVNPITIYSPDLLLEPIVYDFSNNDEIKQYILAQEIPFWAKCIIENNLIQVLYMSYRDFKKILYISYRNLEFS